MDPGTLIGIIAAFGAIYVGMIMEGANPASLIEPSSFVIVIVGSLGATMAGYLFSDTIGTFKVMMKGLLGKKHSSDAVIKDLVEYAEIARRDGLLGLEKIADELDDQFLATGLKLAVDGSDPHQIRDMMATQIFSMKARHKAAAKFFADLGAFGPTLGIIGTVIGLVHMLENLEDPASAGPAIAVAFTATLYGVCMANLFALPMANKLKRISEVEVQHMQLVIEGVLAIQAGMSPRIVREKLVGFLPPSQREALEQPKLQAVA
jgi:chemotaxis protein MotA